MKYFKIFGAIAAIALAGILVGWWNTRAVSKTTTPIFNQAEKPGAVLAAPDPATPQESRAPSIEIINAGTIPRSSDMSLITNWDEQVERILNVPSSNQEKTAALLQIFPRLSEEGQTEVAATLSTLLPDAEYAQLGPYLTNTVTAEPAREVLMSQLLNRPDGVRLPWLLEVARSEHGPEAAEAKGLLQVLLDQDNGTDWQRWQQQVEQHLETKTP